MSPTIQEKIQHITEEILRRLGISFDAVHITEKDDITYRINILTEDASILIGHFGDTLNALQYIIKSIMSDQQISESPLFIICDVEGYKERQEEKVKEIADRLVEKVKTTGVEQHLPPMSPYFRKIIHVYLKEKYEPEGIATESFGESDDRHIVIKLAA